MKDSHGTATQLLNIVVGALAFLVVPAVAFFARLWNRQQIADQEIARLRQEQDAIREQYRGIPERLAKIETLLEILVKSLHPAERE